MDLDRHRVITRGKLRLRRNSRKDPKLWHKTFAKIVLWKTIGIVMVYGVCWLLEWSLLTLVLYPIWVPVVAKRIQSIPAWFIQTRRRRVVLIGRILHWYCICQRLSSWDSRRPTTAGLRRMLTIAVGFVMIPKPGRLPFPWDSSKLRYSGAILSSTENTTLIQTNAGGATALIIVSIWFTSCFFVSAIVCASPVSYQSKAYPLRTVCWLTACYCSFRTCWLARSESAFWSTFGRSAVVALV